MVKLFTSRGTKMSKVVVEMGYKSFVMDTKDGVALMDVLGRAEIYEEKYNREEEATESRYTYHVYPMDVRSGIAMRLMSDELYKLYKLAGKPQD
jgi:hypothetical protein